MVSSRYKKVSCGYILAEGILSLQKGALLLHDLPRRDAVFFFKHP
jgi:hypothetical protein